jgi:hypothetical protein
MIVRSAEGPPPPAWLCEGLLATRRVSGESRPGAPPTGGTAPRGTDDPPDSRATTPEPSGSPSAVATGAETSARAEITGATDAAVAKRDAGLICATDCRAADPRSVARAIRAFVSRWVRDRLV